LVKCQAMLKKVRVLDLENCRKDAKIHYCTLQGRGCCKELVYATLQPLWLASDFIQPSTLAGWEWEDTLPQSEHPLLSPGLFLRACPPRTHSRPFLTSKESLVFQQRGPKRQIIRRAPVDAERTLAASNHTGLDEGFQNLVPPQGCITQCLLKQLLL
ncbi:hypothetical protein PAL_GLEAN10013347, partial [Pteropus alecto]